MHGANYVCQGRELFMSAETGRPPAGKAKYSNHEVDEMYPLLVNLDDKSLF